VSHAADVPDLSVVTMLYRSEAYLHEFHRRVILAAAAVTPRFEIVYVDDGSPDASGAAVRAIASADPRVVLVELSRNFGHHPAAVAGLAHARGRRIFMLDGEPLRLLLEVHVEHEYPPPRWTGAGLTSCSG
jgi:putative glycosyltransferase